MTRYNLISFAGLFLILGFAWLLSADRRRMNWRLIATGMVVQLLLGAVIFMLPAGSILFVKLSGVVDRVLVCATAGSRFLFGPLALGPGQVGDNGETSLGFILMFQALPTVVFFSALMSVLYYFGIMQAIIRFFARLFSRLMRISGAESLCAASNIFVGIESATTIRPYLAKMTRSELCTVLTAGMATIASSVLAFYVFCLEGAFQNIAGHLISASILSAPAALVMSKVLCPESGAPETMGMDVHPHYDKESSVFEAIIHGAGAGMKLLFGIVGLLLAVLGLVALVNLIIGRIGDGVGFVAGIEMEWSLEGILGIVFYPFVVLMGVPPEDSLIASRIIGSRMVLTEVAGYREVARQMQAGGISLRSAVLISYALCGFAHVASLSIFVGGISALVPERTKDLAAVGVRALVAATLACLMTGCIAGIFFSETSVLFVGL
jgi:CNT family concentrative nucleoside transporter